MDKLQKVTKNAVWAEMKTPGTGGLSYASRSRLNEGLHTRWFQG
jgi:hypothetical protein